MNITILTDNPNSWIIPYVNQLKDHLINLHFNVTHITNHGDIKKGDIMFILSCEKILPKEKLNFHEHNIVVHPSKLPEGKGWSPLAWQVLEGKNLLQSQQLVQEPTFVKSLIPIQSQVVEQQILHLKLHLCFPFEP